MDIKFIKRNKFTFFIIIFFVILLVLLFQVKNLFFASNGDANYGDRLDGLVEISADTQDAAISKLKEDERVVEAKMNVSGRILDIIITVKDATSLQDAKTIGSSTSSLFDETVLSNYDLQVFIKKDTESENDFPIIGYKAKHSEGFSFTKDREKTVEEDSE